MEPAFNDQRLAAALSKLTAHQQSAFGAACCERMLPNYETFVRETGWQDSEPLQQGLDAVWDACGGRRLPEAGLREMLARCDARAPDSEDFTSLYVSSAQNAVFSVCSLLEFLLGGDLASIVAVARFATDSVDLVVQELEAMDPRDVLRERRILEHPLMQQELLRQRRDLDDASKLPPDGGMQLIHIRQRSHQEANLRLDS